AQVVDVATGEVVASSANIVGEERISDLTAPVKRSRAETVDRLPVGEGSFRIVARGVQTDDGRFVVYSAATLEPVEESGSTLVGLLATWLPVLLLVVAVVCWIVVGRAMRPVERIRAEVAGIGDRELDRRVPEPGSGDEIDRLAQTMNRMLMRLETAVERQRRFVADASHELRSPLSVMRADLEVDLAHPDHADWRRTEGEVLAETIRLERLVDDLLVLARADAGSLVVPDHLVDLDEIVLEEATRSRTGNGVTIDVSRVSGAQTRGDSLSLRRVVRNLLDNARSHAHATVRVELGEADGSVILTVADDGPGIAESDRARVFERFARVDDARDRVQGGAGLGLAIAREVVGAHGGVVRVADADFGARFVVTLPASSA
ncbi:MAG TPA: HAMP domain-containing sensor histidine kinase, partial [Acidimicrobiia bacterium]|nr:HAMP domain-containing sensor histidine kinase [Acidimicrobiia bacterium]